ncbi:MAG TPA: hypothetical protein VFI38_11035 [Candidatus Acidoferrum sp.]|nr:hypothetical protein [Candidatus Acidoferrum sp.]
MTTKLPKMIAIGLFLTCVALVSSRPYEITKPEAKVTAPQVLSVGVPYYPTAARASHVQGVVHIEVTTNGETVTTTHVEDGPRLLTPFAESNARSWIFVKHTPTKFTLTYTYKLLDHMERNRGFGEVLLRPPDEVEISAMPTVINDPAPDVGG